MHELGIVMQIVESVEKFALQNQVTEIQTLVVQIGELSSMVPHYVEACYPIAVEDTLLQGSEIKIEVLKAYARCSDCEKVYPFLDHREDCPFCQSVNREIISGKELMIKEIIAK